MRHILDLSGEEDKLKFLDSFDLVLSDCDGVLWSTINPIPGSGEAISLLQACGKRIGYITNNSMRTDEEYKNKMREIGIATTPNPDDIVHPVKTIIRHFKNINFNGLIYTIADEVFNNALIKAGYQVMESTSEIYENHKDFADRVSVEEPVNAVILDIDINLNLAKLVKAQHFLKNENCLFILGASDKHVPLKKNFNILGPDGFCKLLKEESGKEPLMVGKPGNMLGNFLKDHFQIKDPKRVLFIGDALIQDIGFGKSCGFQTMAVLSGATNKQQLLSYFYAYQCPDFYADCLADFKEFFKQLNISNEIVKKSSNPF